MGGCQTGSSFACKAQVVSLHRPSVVQRVYDRAVTPPANDEVSYRFQWIVPTGSIRRQFRWSSKLFVVAAAMSISAMHRSGADACGQDSISYSGHLQPC